MRFTLRHRLRSNTDFNLVRDYGAKKVCAFFIVQMLRTKDESSDKPVRRLGVIASRRVGKAVQRNRAKRLLREIFRLNPDVLPQSCDIVLIARKAIIESSFDVIQREYRRLCLRLSKQV